MKDGGYKYFIQILSDQSMQYEYRTMAAFVLSMLVDENSKGQVRETSQRQEYMLMYFFTPGSLSSKQCHLSVSLAAGRTQPSSQAMAGSVLRKTLAQI